MIPKNKLKGKYISYRDKNSAQREGKVVKIIGNTLTIQNAVGEKKRINPNKCKIFGVYFRKKLEDIEWK